MDKQQIFLADEQAHTILASACFAIFTAPLVVYLEGDLGSGKTTFARAFLRVAGFSGSVKSPTYNLLETYPLVNYRLLHFDLYRFHHPSEWEEAGFDDEIDANSLLLIEWPDKAQDFAPKADIRLIFSLHETGRMCTIAPCSERGTILFQQWQNKHDDIS